MEALKLPGKYPVLHNVLLRRAEELQLMMLGIPMEEIRKLSSWEIMRDKILIGHILEKTQNA